MFKINATISIGLIYVLLKISAENWNTHGVVQRSRKYRGGGRKVRIFLPPTESQMAYFVLKLARRINLGRRKLPSHELVNVHPISHNMTLKY